MLRSCIRGAKKGEKVSKGAPIYHFHGADAAETLCTTALCQTNTTGLMFNLAMSVLGLQLHTTQDGFFSDLDHLDLCKEGHNG